MVRALLKQLGAYPFPRDRSDETPWHTALMCQRFELAEEMERMGAGELLIQSVNKDGTYQGLEVAVLHEVSQSVGIPVVGLGGLASLEEIRTIHPRTNLNGYAAGSLFIYQGKHRGVLVNYPSADEVKKLFN